MTKKIKKVRSRSIQVPNVTVVSDGYLAINQLALKEMGNPTRVDFYADQDEGSFTIAPGTDYKLCDLSSGWKQTRSKALVDLMDLNNHLGRHSPTVKDGTLIVKLDS